jgi:large exoprotein involved in heme utilization and adhesion
VFGANARLDVDRSFTATTASGIRIGDVTFSATNPQAVTDVLQVNPSAFLFNQVPVKDVGNFQAFGDLAS